VQPETKGFENPFQINPTPYKNNSKPTQKHRGTIREWICALKYKKIERKMGLGSFGILGKNGGKRKMGGPAVVRGGAERPVVVCKWCGK
jgi:hypothetical protein